MIQVRMNRGEGLDAPLITPSRNYGKHYGIIHQDAFKVKYDKYAPENKKFHVFINHRNAGEIKFQGSADDVKKVMKVVDGFYDVKANNLFTIE